MGEKWYGKKDDIGRYHEQQKMIEVAKEVAEKCRKDFLQPFDEDEVIKNFEKAETFKDIKRVRKPHGNFMSGPLAYQRSIGNLFHYEVHAQGDLEENENKKLDTLRVDELNFSLWPTKSEKIYNDATSMFVFRREYTQGPEKDWNLRHRLSRGKEFGITGTLFLAKAEEYMRILAKAGKISCTGFVARASQPEVANWLLKNGYIVNEEASQDSFKNFQKNLSEYTTVAAWEQGGSYPLNSYWIHKQTLEEIEKGTHPILEEGHVSFVKDPLSPGKKMVLLEHSSDSFKEFLQIVPNFTFIKDIEGKKRPDSGWTDPYSPYEQELIF